MNYSIWEIYHDIHKHLVHLIIFGAVWLLKTYCIFFLLILVKLKLKLFLINYHCTVYNGFALIKMHYFHYKVPLSLINSERSALEARNGQMVANWSFCMLLRYWCFYAFTMDIHKKQLQTKRLFAINLLRKKNKPLKNPWFSHTCSHLDA